MENYRVKVQKKLEFKTDEQFLKHGGRFYNVSIKSNGHFTIIDMTNAGRRGTKCYELSLNSDRNAPDCAHWNELLSDHTPELLEAATNQVCPEKLKKPYFRFYLNKLESIRLMPLDLSIIKPLTKMPKKWSIPHIVRALVNEQYENLKKNSYYTDDYAWDNACNFREGRISDAIEFARGIIEHPDGWRAWINTNGVVSLNCYSFNNNEFTPKIEEKSMPKKKKVITSNILDEAKEMTPEEAKKILKNEGLQVMETMTNPSRPGKKPRPVWQVSGRTEGLESIFYDLGCSKRRWRGAFSFWDDDPTLEIAKAIKKQGRLSFIEQQEQKDERAKKRAERFMEYSDNASKRADARIKASNALVEGIPFGQPILVGHHSEARHRRTLERSRNNMFKACDENKKAKYYEERAESINYRLENKEKGLFYFQNRINENEKRLRNLELSKGYYPDYESRKLELEDKLAYFKKIKNEILEERKRDKKFIATPDSLAKGDLAKYRGTWYPVIRVNKKSITIGNWLGIAHFQWRACYSQVSDVKRSDD